MQSTSSVVLSKKYLKIQLGTNISMTDFSNCSIVIFGVIATPAHTIFAKYIQVYYWKPEISLLYIYIMYGTNVPV